MEAMVKRIHLECRGKEHEHVKHLNLDCCRSNQIYGLTEDFKNLETLSMINTGLTTLKGFPSLPSLKKLELSDNRLQNGLEALQGCKKLTQLSLGGNRFKDISSLEPLKELPNLKNLDLFNCEVTNVEDYRKKVYELLPTLEVLDNSDKSSKSVAENNEDEYGSGSDEEDDTDEEDDDLEDGYNCQLNYLEKSGLENESEGEDFVPGQEVSEDEIDEEDEEDEDGDGGGGDDDDGAGGDYDDEDEENAEENDTKEASQGSRKRKRPADEEEGN